jgi:hypothetical protein
MEYTFWLYKNTGGKEKPLGVIVQFGWQIEAILKNAGFVSTSVVEVPDMATLRARVVGRHPA